jgi:hypothetical protein
MRQRFGEQCGFVSFGTSLVIVFIQKLTIEQVALHGKVVVLATAAHGSLNHKNDASAVCVPLSLCVMKT